MVAIKHVHRVKKHVYKKTGAEIYFCTLPDCTFKVESQFMLGKETVCNICMEPFIVTAQTLKLKLPHCKDCGRVEVKDASGRKRYITKVNNRALSSVAADATGELKLRLAAAISTVAEIEDEDL